MTFELRLGSFRPLLDAADPDFVQILPAHSRIPDPGPYAAHVANEVSSRVTGVKAMSAPCGQVLLAAESWLLDR